MDEKTMVNDVLDGVKASLTTYQGVISKWIGGIKKWMKKQW